MSAMIFDIARFALHDGPGIRTVVFLKGCPLRCLWCHNPESQRPEPELFFTPEKCLGCGGCAAVCPRHCHRFGAAGHGLERGNCLHCGKCAAACIPGALAMVGRRWTADEVLAEVLKDRDFYRNSGGGLTLSGGEPLAQPEFLRELLPKAKAAGLQISLETCGYAPWELLRELLPEIDLFLYDLKATDPEKHRRFTGVDNARILENLRQLDAAGGRIILRCPLIPGVNDDPAHLDALAALAERLRNLQEIQLQPYHPLGVDKCARLGVPCPLELRDFTAPETVAVWLARIRQGTRVPVRRS